MDISAWSITVFDATFLVHKQTQSQTLSSMNPFWEKTFWARAEHAVKKHAIPVHMIWTLSNMECDVHNSFLWPTPGRVGVCGQRPCPMCLHWATVQIYPSGNPPNPKVAYHENESLRSFKKKTHLFLFIPHFFYRISFAGGKCELKFNHVGFLLPYHYCYQKGCKLRFSLSLGNHLETKKCVIGDMIQ